MEYFLGGSSLEIPYAVTGTFGNFTLTFTHKRKTGVSLHLSITADKETSPLTEAKVEASTTQELIGSQLLVVPHSQLQAAICNLHGVHAIKDQDVVPHGVDRILDHWSLLFVGAAPVWQQISDQHQTYIVLLVKVIYYWCYCYCNLLLVATGTLMPTVATSPTLINSHENDE